MLGASNYEHKPKVQAESTPHTPEPTSANECQACKPLSEWKTPSEAHTCITPKNDWREEFDEVFGYYLSGYYCCDGRECGCDGTTVRVEICDYIQNLLDQHSSQIVERIEKAKKHPAENTSFIDDESDRQNFNLGLDQAIDIIKGNV